MSVVVEVVRRSLIAVLQSVIAIGSARNSQAVTDRRGAVSDRRRAVTDRNR